MAGDDDQHEQRLLGLLRFAAMEAVLPSWPSQSPPWGSPDLPPVEAQRDDDGVVAVYRFFRVVEENPEPLLELTVQEALASVEGLDDVAVGDEVGVELPLLRVAAIALCHLTTALSGRRSLLPEVFHDILDDEVGYQRLLEELTALRGPLPSTPDLVTLRGIVVDHGGAQVEWTGACDPPELLLLLSNGGVSRIVGVKADGHPRRRQELLRLLHPPVTGDGLWGLLATEGARLIAPPSSVEASANERRCALEVTAVDIARDAARFGEVTVTARLSQQGDDDPKETTQVPLQVDVTRLLGTRVDDAARHRIEAASQVFARRLQARLQHLVESGGGSSPAAVLLGSASLRVLARAAAGVALSPRGGIELDLSATDEGALDVLLMPEGSEGEPFWAIRFQPGDDSAEVRLPDGRFRCFYSSGALIDGDVEAWRAAAAMISEALADTDADIELAFDEEGEDVQPFSAWLRALAECDVVGWLPADAEAATAWQEVVDVLLEER